MAVENYKKFIVLGIVALFAAIIIIAIMTSSSPYKPGKSTQRSTQRGTQSAGPLVDTNTNKIMPLEELGADQKDPNSLSLLGDKYFEGGNFNQAIEIYKRVLELNPNDVDTYNDIGLAYMYTKRPELAVDSLQKGIEVMPSFQRIRLSLGFVLMASGRNEEAKTALEAAAALDPNSTVGREAKRMADTIK